MAGHVVDDSSIDGEARRMRGLVLLRSRRFRSPQPSPESAQDAAGFPSRRTMVGDLLGGRLGVDAIALLSMSAAVALGQLVALMYSGGNVLENIAIARAEHDLRSLVDCAPRLRGRDGRHITAELGLALHHDHQAPLKDLETRAQSSMRWTCTARDRSGLDRRSSPPRSGQRRRARAGR